MKDLAKHLLKLWALPWLITSPFIYLGWPIWAYTLIFGVFHILLRVGDGRKSKTVRGKHGLVVGDEIKIIMPDAISVGYKIDMPLNFMHSTPVSEKGRAKKLFDETQRVKFGFDPANGKDSTVHQDVTFKDGVMSFKVIELPEIHRISGQVTFKHEGE